MKTVIKRDGRRKEFNSKFIDIAISKAEEEVKGISSDLGIRVASLIEDYLDENSIEEISIEQIQDLVVEYLNQEDKDIAKAYNDYRERRTKVREANASLLNDIEDIFNQTSEEIRNNANKAGDKLQTYRAMVADVACNKYADLKKAFGTDENKLFDHFINFGMKEGRRAISTFNVIAYKNRYVDLQKAFGDDLPSYYRHYIQFGKKEGRSAV